MSGETGVEKANRMARAARARVMGLARTAREMGAVPAPRAGETLPEALRGGPEKNPDPLDLPADLHPVGGRPPGMPDLMLPGEKLPVGMQGRAAVKAILEAARESGLRGASGWMMCIHSVSDLAAVFDPPINGSAIPGSVRCYPTGHGREAIREAMIEAIMTAAHDKDYRPTYRMGAWMDDARRARWGEIVAMGPQTKGLRSKLTAETEAAQTEAGPGGHIGRWFQCVAGRLADAAYDAGVPLIFSCTETRPSGFQVKRCATPATQLATDPDAQRWAGGYTFYIDPHAYEPAEFAANVIDVILYGNYIDENTDEHARLARELQAAAVARFTPVPEAPPPA